jgi:hypothetical protein
MFEKSFQWTIRHGARLLFIGCLFEIVLAAAISALQVLLALHSPATPPLGSLRLAAAIGPLTTAIEPAALLLFGAVLLEIIRRRGDQA